MFENIGSKIKTLAQVITIIGIVGSVILGLVLMDADELYAILIAVLGSLFSWLGSFLLYGFGELVENSKIIADKMKENTGNTAATAFKANEISAQVAAMKVTIENK